jgi:chromosome segregation ATPase
VFIGSKYEQIIKDWEKNRDVLNFVPDKEQLDRHYSGTQHHLDIVRAFLEIMLMDKTGALMKDQFHPDLVFGQLLKEMQGTTTEVQR